MSRFTNYSLSRLSETEGYTGKEILSPDSPNSARIDFLIRYLKGVKDASDLYSLHTALRDILYGVGLCISTEDCKNVEGFSLWQEVLAMVVRDGRYLSSDSVKFSTLIEEAKTSLLLRKTFEEVI